MRQYCFAGPVICITYSTKVCKDRDVFDIITNTTDSVDVSGRATQCVCIMSLDINSNVSDLFIHLVVCSH